MESATRVEFLLGAAFCEYKAHLCVSICFGLQWTGWEKANLIKVGSGAVGRWGWGNVPDRGFLFSCHCEELRRGVERPPGGGGAEQPSCIQQRALGRVSRLPPAAHPSQAWGLQGDLSEWKARRLRLPEGLGVGGELWKQASHYSENSNFTEKCPQSLRRLLLDFFSLFFFKFSLVF